MVDKGKVTPLVEVAEGTLLPTEAFYEAFTFSPATSSFVVLLAETFAAVAMHSIRAADFAAAKTELNMPAIKLNFEPLNREMPSTASSRSGSDGGIQSTANAALRKANGEGDWNFNAGLDAAAVNKRSRNVRHQRSLFVK